MMDGRQHTKTEKELKGEGKFLQNIMATIPDSLLVLNKDLRIKSANRSFYKLFQTKPQKVTGSKITDILGGGDVKFSAKLTKLFGTEDILENFELHYQSEKLGERIFNITARGIIVAEEEEEEEEEEELVVIQDITERNEAEELYITLANSSPVGVYVVQNRKFLFVNPQFQKYTGFSEEELLGMDSLKLVHPKDRELVRENAIKMLKGERSSAYEFRTITKGGETRWIMETVTSIHYKGKRATLGNYMDITERKRAQEQLERSFLELAETVSRAMESRDPYTSGHQRGVAELAHLVGKKLGLDEDRLNGLYIGGLLHDIGKVSTPASILSKSGELTDEEWSLIRAHTKQGYKILKDTKLPWPIADMALHHHERLNGSGYPHGIKGDKMSLEVRILAVCDVVEAMSSHRPYRPARRKEEVLEEIKDGKGTKYDPDVVDIMLQIIESGEFGV